jgi:putative polyketide hydroxylase
MGEDIADPEGAWPTAYEVDDDGAVLVRPDGHVAWRSRGGSRDPEGALSAAMDAILGLVPHQGALAR